MWTLFLPIVGLNKKPCLETGQGFCNQAFIYFLKNCFLGATKLGSFFSNKKNTTHFGVMASLNLSPFSPG
jgi:hypothetical protein